MPNQLYFGDNLDILRERVKDNSVDLIYLDPPFNSKAQYNVLFRTPAGQAAEAQAEAFHDTWTWGSEAETAFAEVLRSGSPAAGILDALRRFLDNSDMMAYLAMMTVRLVELRRVLKETGSLYLHCDPTASHYLKIILDGLFGVDKFVNEIIWKRAHAKGHAYTRFPSAHDALLLYRKSEHFCWNSQYVPHSESYVKSHYRSIEPETGRQYMLDNCLNPNPNRPNLTYEWNGQIKVWRWTKERMKRLHDEGRLVYTKSGTPRYKRYLDEMRGAPVTSVWADIFPVNSQARERLGYPTQKPLALLERIIQASSNPGDVVLDPFCGCGTTVHAAQRLGRQWLGIDITHYAITVIENRLKSAFPDIGDVPVWGRPTDLGGARELARRDKFQFQWWANWRIGAQAYHEHKRGADRGIDGMIYFRNGPFGTGRILVSVKGGEHVGVSMIRDLRGALEREGAELGLFLTLAAPTQPMRTEAIAAGFNDTAHGRFPRLQIATVEEMLTTRLNLPPPYEVHAIDVSPRRRRAPAPSPQLELALPIRGGRQEDKRTGDVVYADPRVRFKTAAQ